MRISGASLDVGDLTGLQLAETIGEMLSGADTSIVTPLNTLNRQLDHLGGPDDGSLCQPA
jgi:hypothetical protein